MGIVIDSKQKWIQGHHSKVWNWALHYAMAKSDSPALARKFLEKEVPGQLWYQVQTTAEEHYK